MPLPYPTPPTSDQVDDYHGPTVPDPFRPLEDTDAPETRAWITAENELSAAVLGQVPSRGAIAGRLAELWDYPRASVPWRHGGRWFQLRNTGLQDQDVLWTADAREAEGRLLLDPNALNEEGTTTLNAIAVSHSGELVAIATSDAGSDWQTWRVRRTDTGEDLPDRIAWSKFAGAAWTHDDAGFFYGRFPAPAADSELDAPNRLMELCYHRLGDDPATDRVVFATPEQPEWGFEPEVSSDGSFLVVTVWRGTDPENRVYLADLGNGVDRADVRPLLDAADAHYELVATMDRSVYLLTNLDAPRGRLVAVDVDDPAATIRGVIPEGEDALEACSSRAAASPRSRSTTRTTGSRCSSGT